MLLGTSPDKLFLDKSIVTTAFRFPIWGESGPFREFDVRFSTKMSLRFHKVEGIAEPMLLQPNKRFLKVVTLPKQGGIEPESLLPFKDKSANLF